MCRKDIIFKYNYFLLLHDSCNEEGWIAIPYSYIIKPGVSKILICLEVQA